MGLVFHVPCTGKWVLYHGAAREALEGEILTAGLPEKSLVSVLIELTDQAILYLLDFHGGPVGKTCLPMQGILVRSLVWEDPTCHRATKPVHHSY